jgi:hypothetical protein
VIKNIILLLINKFLFFINYDEIYDERNLIVLIMGKFEKKNILIFLIEKYEIFFCGKKKIFRKKINF